MRDYRPLLSDVANLLEELTDKIKDWGGGAMIDAPVSFSKEEIEIMLEQINDMFNEMDNELGDG